MVLTKSSLFTEPANGMVLTKSRRSVVLTEETSGGTVFAHRTREWNSVLVLRTLCWHQFFSVCFLPVPSFSCAFFISPKMQCSAVHLFFAVRYCNRHQHQQTKLRATVALYSLIAVDFPPNERKTTTTTPLRTECQSGCWLSLWSFSWTGMPSF